MTSAPIRVLLVDDDPDSLDRLARLVRGDPSLRLAAALTDGQAAVDFVREHSPDVVLMDTRMPGLDGFEATRAIMENWPVPIVMCSDPADEAEVAVAFHSMEAGAVSCIPRPGHAADPAANEAAATVLRTLRLMSEVKVVRRWPRGRARNANGRGPKRAAAIRAVGVGASTGGPPVLQAILGALPKAFPVPMLVVQHISPGFLPGLAQWLADTTGFRVVIAAHDVIPLPAHVYLAPDDFHLGLAPGGAIALSRAHPENGLRPAVSFLFRSLAEQCGAGAVGVLLSGMGKDGAAELGLMRDRGAATIAQDRETSVVHGMPGEAIVRGAAEHVLPADAIAPMLAALVARRAAGPEEGW